MQQETEDTQEEDDTTRERFIAYFDILGFKERIWRTEHHELVQTMRWLRKDLLEVTRRTVEVHRKTLKPTNPERVHFVQFSDSILFVTDNDSRDAASILMHKCTRFVALCAAKHLPVKGVLAHGLFTADFGASLYLGQPLIDAYLLEEQVKLYGAILHHSAEKKMSEEGLIPDHMCCVQYATPLQGKTVTHYNLNWAWAAAVLLGLNLEELRNSLYHQVSGQARIYVDNTFAFVDKVAKQHEHQELPS
ncbi:MAG: hypothetical protein GF418_16015 [Chitinivibrionales bacterium]|nr:hypothetical protein [Chitinivibrionales bacterium]